VAEAGDIEGLLDLGGESGEPQSPSGAADPLAMAAAIEQARHDPELSRKIGAYLDEQRKLVKLQVRHFDEERRLAIAAAKRKRLMDRLRIALQLLIALIIGAAIAGCATALWSAFTDRSTVIDAASVPADLAERGFTGQVVAKEILDRFAEINESSSPARAANSYANSWGTDIKLQIPETGISVGELSRLLHEHLGHITHIESEVTRSADEVSVSIRVGDEYAVEAVGPQTNLKALVQDAATRMYAKTQPYRYGFWLYSTGNAEAAATVFRQLALSGPRIERIWALHGLAIASDSNRAALALDQQVLDLDPDFYLSRLTMADDDFALGHDEAGLAESRAVIAAEDSGADETLSRSGRARIRARAALDRDAALGDYEGMMVSADEVSSALMTERTALNVWMSKIDALIHLHDVGAAAGALALLPPAEAGFSAAQNLLLKAELAAESNDSNSVIGDLERARPLLDKLTERSREQLTIKLNPLLAEAYARVARNAEADAVLAAMPADAYDSHLAQGQVAELRRNFAGAETALAAAVREAPSIPRAYFDWGNLLLEKGDLAGAAMKYAEASRRGRHWADPLKAWGDVLAKQGKPEDALEKYDEALKYAPRWEQLKEVRAAAAKQKS